MHKTIAFTSISLNILQRTEHRTKYIARHFSNKTLFNSPYEQRWCVFCGYMVVRNVILLYSLGSVDCVRRRILLVNYANFLVQAFHTLSYCFGFINRILVLKRVNKQTLRNKTGNQPLFIVMWNDYMNKLLTLFHKGNYWKEKIIHLFLMIILSSF